jgi:hypothetical protein
MKSRFRVLGKLDGTGGARDGTVLIDRMSGIIEVRPIRRRRTYALHLSDVATWICQRVIMAELAEKRAAKRQKRRRSRVR